MNKNNLYRLRVEAALEYIDNNIDSNLSLQSISNVSGFSPYHFHRIFREVTGKNLHEYILTRRLNLAANQLLYETCDITKIALDNGFSTPSALSKSFKETFGCTPTQYKEHTDRKYPAEFTKISFPQYKYDNYIEQCFYETTLPDLQTLCAGVTGLSESWENSEIEKAHQQIFHWLRKNPSCKSTQICGITMDTPEVQSLSDCRYYACASVGTYMYSESLAFRTFKTSGQYIYCKMNRTQTDFAEHFFKYMDCLYGFYLQQHELLPDIRPFVEFYEPAENKKINIIFCVPVKKARIDGKRVSYATSNMGFTTPFSLTANPVIVIPIGRSKDGLPVGVQLAGKRFRDLDLIKIAEVVGQTI
jgi:AraC family transcriptional regulator